MPSIPWALSNATTEARLFKGRIYMRTDAARSEEVHDPSLLQKMINAAISPKVG
jgi:hypothetical protein